MNDLTPKKSFWKRPETPGQLLMYGGLGLLGFWVWGKISSFVLQTISNTFWMAVYGIGLALLAMIVLSPKTHLIIRLISRKITGLIIELDPIGILKDRVEQLLKRMESFSEKKEALAGAKKQVDSTIRRNDEELSQQQKVVEGAKAMLARPGTNATTTLRAQTELRIATNEVDRITRANKEYAHLSTTLARIQEVLERGEIYLDGFIRDGRNEARQWEIKRKTSGIAKGAISDALSILKGKASEQDLYQSTLDHLADEYDTRLGLVDEGLKDLEAFMLKVDLQTGVVDADAFAFVNDFEKKLALPPAVQQPQLTSESMPKVPVGRTVDVDYTEMFKKKEE